MPKFWHLACWNDVVLAAELKCEPSAAATQLPHWDSSIGKAISSVGVAIDSADDLGHFVVIYRKEMYLCIENLRQLTRLEN